MEEEYNRARFVFTAVVKDSGNKIGDNNRLAEVKVLDSFKGDLEGEVRVRTYVDSIETMLLDAPGCSMPMKRGQTYLIFAYNHRGKRGPAYVDGCTYTRPISVSQKVIGEVKALSRKSP